jgi:ankyrin repeat protein
VVPDRAQSCWAEGILRQQLKRLENNTQRVDSSLSMKSKLIAIVAAVAAVVLVGVWLLLPPPIHRAAVTGNIEAFKQHLAAGADVNVKDNLGMTPLSDASRNGHREIVELLITNGADVNVKTDYGRTPLDLASGETADLLRKHGGKTGKELKAEGK